MHTGTWQLQSLGLQRVGHSEHALVTCKGLSSPSAFKTEDLHTAWMSRVCPLLSVLLLTTSWGSGCHNFSPWTTAIVFLRSPCFWSPSAPLCRYFSVFQQKPSNAFLLPIMTISHLLSETPMAPHVVAPIYLSKPLSQLRPPHLSGVLDHSNFLHFLV